MRAGRKDAYATAVGKACVAVARRRAGNWNKLARLSGIDSAHLRQAELLGVGMSWASLVVIARAVGMLPSALVAEAEAHAAAAGLRGAHQSAPGHKPEAELDGGTASAGTPFPALTDARASLVTP